jgi:hypothetical protein
MDSTFGLSAQAFAQEVNIVVQTEMTCAPYWFPDKTPPDRRLMQAIALVIDGKVTATPGGEMYQVQGSTQVYTITGPCSCPQGTKGKTSWCKHKVAVELYKRVLRRLGKPLQAALALPPTTVDERIARAPVVGTSHGMAVHAVPVEDVMDMAQERTDGGAREATAPPEDDASESPTRTEDTSMTTATNGASTILEPDVVTSTALAPVQTQSDLERSIAEWTRNRKVLAAYIKEHMKDGIDYYTLRIHGRETKPTLSKAGSEKFLSLFHLHASFRKDEDTWDMLGKPAGLLCYVCTLATSSGEVVGEGRGARSIKDDKGDVNKAIKMAEKSSQADAILRTGALSDLFTQDQLEEEQGSAEKDGHSDTKGDHPEPEPEAPNVEHQKRQISALLKVLKVDITRKEACEEAVLHHTGMPLLAVNYAAIIDKLKAQLAAQAA